MCDKSVITTMDVDMDQYTDADLDAAMETARKHGIKMTNAEFHTEMCDAWVARVLAARMAEERGDTAYLADCIKDANAYAI